MVVFGVVLGAAVAGVGVSYAVDDGGGDSNLPTLEEMKEASQGPDISFEEATAALGVTQEQIDSDNATHIGPGTDSESVVSDCEKDLASAELAPEDALTCRVILAKASGELEPGSYSDSGLQEALDRAEATP